MSIDVKFEQIKPGVDWLDTGPLDIFSQAGSVKFDYSDLEEVVLKLLQDPDALQRRSDLIDPRRGKDNITQRYMEQFASILRPLVVRKRR